MPRLRSKATGVVIEVSDDFASSLDGFEPADAAGEKGHAKSAAKRAPAKASADDKAAADDKG